MFEKLQKARQLARERGELRRLLDECRKLLTERGESNSVAIATGVIERYRALPADAVHALFSVLAAEFDPDPGEVLMLAEQYAVSRTPENLIRLSRAAEPRRQELLRRLNRAPQGTATIVAMRAQLLDRLRSDRQLAAVDADFQHLLSSWFNPGFLNLVRVDWDSPARLLEQIIRHEAVHEIDGWGDLRRRLEPDRRCFAFFHPALPDEPLIFVEVALLPDMPGAIAPLLARDGAGTTPASRFKVAAFYSISNCQPGLRGINLGNFLIKRVAERIRAELPSVRTFCTLSPIPSFAQWLGGVEEIESARLKPATLRSLNEALLRWRARGSAQAPAERAAARAATVTGEAAGMRVKAAPPAGETSPDAEGNGDRDLKALCAFYLLHTSASEPPSDPVARFHLNNGARLERINTGADLSRKGMRESHGLMVNYLYDLDEIESNHERFIDGEVTASRAVRASL